MLRIFGIAGGAVVVCLAVFVLYILGYIHWRPPNFALLTHCSSCHPALQHFHIEIADPASQPFFGYRAGAREIQIGTGRQLELRSY